MPVVARWEEMRREVLQKGCRKCGNKQNKEKKKIEESCDFELSKQFVPRFD